MSMLGKTPWNKGLRGATTHSAATRAKQSASHTKHGHRPGAGASPTYRSWAGMLQRCRNPNNPRYRDYGGRGITVCERWSSFVNFLADMGERPPGKTLDRRDVDGNYEPHNCTWSTPKEQHANRRKA
jgi:hypothetical protein